MKTFTPDEIIFACTDSCNLKCPHCFVSRRGHKLDIADAKNFISSCIAADSKDTDGLATEWRVGFSGGEPFLNLDFLCEISAFCVENNIIFDRIMTNAIWWKSEEELSEKLTRLYDSGYDGKFGISFDSFHGGDFRYTAKFCRKVFELWKNSSSIEIQTTYDTEKNSLHTLKTQKKMLYLLSLELGGKVKYTKNGARIIVPNMFEIPVYIGSQSHQYSKDEKWNDKKWFKDDLCTGPGNIFYVHADGNVAPCCGFANENKELFIGTIKDSYEKLMKNAEENRMANICFSYGLEKFRLDEEKKGRKFNGKTCDICQFCDWACRNTK